MRCARTLALATLAMAVLAGGARAQPFEEFLRIDGPGDGYVEVPHSPTLNPAARITIEMWVSAASTADCRLLIGKGYATSYAVGLCNGTLVSSLRGASSVRSGGAVTSVAFHHVAVTYDGSHRRHYVDGELVADFVESGSLPPSTRPLRIGGDVDMPNASIDGFLLEVRLWSVARTQAQLQQGLDFPLSGPQPGLVAQWHLAGDAHDAVGGHHGTAHGNILWDVFGHGSGGPDCVADTKVACFAGNRFSAVGNWTTYTAGPPGTPVSIVTRGGMSRVPGSSDGAAVFWFFAADNWELLVKAVNGCSLNDHWWIFSAATTNVHYALTVYDNFTGRLRVYHNFSGPPAPAVTDVNAFPCP